LVSRKTAIIGKQTNHGRILSQLRKTEGGMWMIIKGKCPKF